MHNEHNAVARLIGNLQQRWLQATQQQPKYKIIRWVMQPGQAALVNGFCRLESTAHGKTPELLVVLLTPFTTAADFTRQLMQVWLGEWCSEGNTLRNNWPAAQWQERLQRRPEGVEMIDLVAMLRHFEEYAGNPQQQLVLGLLPRSIGNGAAFGLWLHEMLELLPPGIKLMVAEHAGSNELAPLVRHWQAAVITLDITDLDLQQAIWSVATAGTLTSRMCNTATACWKWERRHNSTTRPC